LPGLSESVIPIVPVERTFSIVIPNHAGDSVVTKTVTRRQLPVTPAYAFTNYRSQGQTIPIVVVDIASPARGSPLSLFNVYVALSRSSGRETI
ncbi:hypothetical protein OF83DRAFT_1042920, partial [Amylostereum chailletii]